MDSNKEIDMLNYQIDSLNLRKDALEANKDKMPEENYQRQKETVEISLAEQKNLLAAAVAKNLKEKTTEETTEVQKEDNKTENKDSQEIRNKAKQQNKNELLDKDEELTKLKDSIELAREKELFAEKDYQASINEFLRIFAEEREIRENDGPFQTSQELDDFTDKYMDLKMKENTKFLDAKKRIELSRKNIENIENKINKRISELQDHKKNDLDNINVVYDTDPSPKKIEGSKEDKLTDNDKKEIVVREKKLPMVIKQPVNKNHGDTPEDMKPVSKKEETKVEEQPTKEEKPVENKEEKPELIKKIDEPIEQLEPEKPKRGLMTIIEEITKDLNIKKKDGKRYAASNIKVSQKFKNELHSGNYLYNVVHFVPTLAKVPFQLFTKLTNKVMYHKNAKERMEKLKSRINELPESDLMIIYNEYRASKVNQERFPTALNTLLNERIQRFALDKVTEINENLEEKYSDIYTSVKELEAVDNLLKNDKLSKEDKDKLTNYRSELLSGKAEEIASIRKNYIDANNWLSGGSHGFSEDMKGAATKLSCVGKRFAKTHDLDLDLLKKEAALERAENKAIAEKDDETALKIFVQAESLLSSNTDIQRSVFGKRSTGKKYYSPLAEQLDYQNDPFIRDLFTTIALTSATISAVNALRTHSKQIQNEETEKVNAQNEAKMESVRQAGNDITAKRNTMTKGMEAQSKQDVLNSGNQIERAALDKSAEKYGGWSLSSKEYKEYDAKGHDFYNNLYDQTQESIKEVTKQYGSGAITQEQAMEMMNNISKNSQNTLGSVTNECLEILKDYAPNHKQFDLHGIKEAMEYMKTNPDAITNMNQAMVDVTNIGEQLQGMTASKLSVLEELPSDLQTTLFSAASAGALAYKVSTTMQKNVKKGKYGNAVTDMVNNYQEQQTVPVESTGRSK